MTASQQIESQTLQQINRLVSASSPSDALESIYTLSSTLKQSISSPFDYDNKNSNSSDKNDFETVLSIVTESKEFLKSICILLSESKLQSSTSKRMMDVEEGDVAVLSFLISVLDYYKKQQESTGQGHKQKQPKYLSKLIGKFEEEEFHQSLSIIHSLLDVVSVHGGSGSNIGLDAKRKSSTASSSTLYKQSTTLSILSTLLQIIPTPTVTNILQTPHGLNRIIDLFKNTTNNPQHQNNHDDDDDEKIILRNESIILAISLVKLNPGIAKFMIFEDVYDSLMAIASFEYQTYLSSRQSNTGVSRKDKNNVDSGSSGGAIINGNLIIVRDCLELCIEMTKQESKMGSETFLSNNMTCQVLTMLLDLRNGVYFRNYDVCLDDYYMILELEEEESKRKNHGFMNGAASSGDNDKVFDHELSLSSSEDGLDDILLDAPISSRNGVSRSREGGGRDAHSNKYQNGGHVNGKDDTIRKYPIPHNTDEESEIISYALSLLQVLIQGGDEGFVVDESKTENVITLKKSTSVDSTSSETKHQVSSRIKSIVSSKNTQRLSMLLFDMALYTLPPPNSPIEFYVSSVPSTRIQCQALNVVADLGKIAKMLAIEEGEDELLDQILSCQSMYLKEVGCLERVMYLICTGGISFDVDEDDYDNKKLSKSKVNTMSEKAVEAISSAKKVSMHSLGLLRQFLTPNEAKMMLMQAFSPPVNDIDDEIKEEERPPPIVDISVVQKLVNTMAENLHLLNDPKFSKDLKAVDKERMHINIIGAAGALGVFLTNGAGDTSREVLLRLPLPPPPPILKKINGTQDEDNYESSQSLVECIMTYLELGTRTSGNFSNNTPSPETSMDVTFSLLRLLTEWVPQTPNVISAVLSSPNSVSLGFLLQQKSNKSLSVESIQVLQALTGILLGLCMESMDAEDDVGGWSTSSIMNLINVGIGIGKFTQLLEGLKRIIVEGDAAKTQTSVGPWMCCNMERNAMLLWYSSSVNIVRRKVVQELSANDESDNDNDEITDSDKKNVKSLSRLVAHQNSEIETLRQKLVESEDRMASQASEMNLLKRRIGSNPNKVDDLLDEYSAKILLLEIQAKNLKEEVTKNNSKHQSTLKQQKEELSQLRQELDSSRSETQSILTEKDALQNELKQISFAYSNLETEYNRITSNSSLQTIGDKTAESNNAQNTNYQVLQSENLKLKNDIRNANDWMSKAVKKMDDLTKRNTTLEAEAARLSNGNTQNEIMTGNLSQEADKLKRQLHDMTNERNILLENVDNCKEEISKLQVTQRELETLQSHSSKILSQMKQIEVELENQKRTSSETITELQQQLNRKNEEMLVMQNSRQNEHESELQQELAKLSAAYKAAQDWMAQAVTSNEKLKKQVDQLKQENITLQSNISSTNDLNDSKKNSLEQEVVSLTTQRDEALEKKKALDQKLKDNEELQAELLNEKNALQESVNEMIKEKVILDEFKNKAEELDLKLKDAESLQVELSLEKEALKEKLNEMMKEIGILSDFKTKAEEFERQMMQMAMAKDQALETAKNLTRELEESSLCQETLTKELSEARAKMDEMNGDFSEAVVLREKSINLQKELDAENLKHASEVDMLKKTLDEMKEENEQIQMELNILKTNSKSLTDKHEEQNLAYTTLQGKIEIIEKENQELKMEKENNASTIDDMHSRLNDFQTWTDVAQERFKELELERQQLQEAIDQMKSNEEKLTQTKSQAEEKIKELTNDVESLKAKQTEGKREEENLRSEILSLQVEIGHLDGKNRALSEDNKVLEKENADLTSKVDLLDDVEESLFEKENEVTMLQNELESEKEKLQRLQQSLDECNGKQQGTIEELELCLREKETQLIHQEAEAREAISQWEERCESLSSEINSCKEERDEIERSFMTLEAEIASYHKSLEELNKTIDAERKEKLVQTARNEEAENAYKNHIIELENAIQEHVEAVQQYESQLDERDEALVRAGTEIEALNKEIVDNAKESEDVVTKWQENSRQLEETIAALESTIDDQDNDANTAIAQWEARCNSLCEQILLLEQQISSEDSEIKIKELEKLLGIKNEELAKAKELECRVSNDLFEANSAVKRLQNELQAVKESLTVERGHREDNISEVKTLSAEKADILEQLKKEKSLLKQSLHQMEAVKVKAEDLSIRLDKTKKCLHDVTQASKKHEEDKVASQAIFQQQKQELLLQIHSLEEEKRLLEESNESDKSEANEMKLIIGQLENELKEANDILQSHLTDEVTARATEMATNALRAQLKESREKQSHEHEALLNEKEARQFAEKEVQKLKADLALLLEAENISDSNDTKMKQFTSKAAGEVLARQRGEIDALTKSLEQLMQELQSCQSKERVAEERAANSRLHAAACEQELTGAKSDVVLLKDSIEMLKNDEFEMRTKLEHCVKSLEQERESIIASLGSEIKNLKAEISRDQIERDRLIHALNESEKANSALVYSTSIGQEENDSSLELELAKLRLEKAQLLAAVQENGSKFEQRIRSESEKKSSEKELIESAEKSLSGLQKKYEDTVAQLELANASNLDLLKRMKETNTSELKNDLHRLQSEVQKLQKTNEELKSQLANKESQSNCMYAKLEEKCRLAEAKIIDLESQERKEAAVAAEVARLRDETKGLSIEEPNTNYEYKESSLAADEMHDVVLELRQTVMEERQVYQDLLSEHEDLLALLAQQDLEKSSLQLALVQCAGEEAVVNAFLDAEQQSVQQFGKYIKLK